MPIARQRIRLAFLPSQPSPRYRFGIVCMALNYRCFEMENILKPGAPRPWGGVQNEAFCLTLARRMRIPTPDVTTGQAGKRTYLLVKRYDRMDVGGRWRGPGAGSAKSSSSESSSRSLAGSSRRGR